MRHPLVCGLLLWSGLAAADSLYVQRASALRWGRPDGPVIGRVLPGALLPIVGGSGHSAEVTVPAYYDLGTLEPGCCLHIGDLHAFVERAILSKSKLPLTATTPSGRVLRDYELTLSTGPHGELFTRTLCGDLYVMDRPSGAHVVTQVHDGVEITGWSNEPLPLARGRRLCPPRVVTSNEVRPRGTIPAGFAAVQAPANVLVKQLAPLIKARASLYLPMLQGSTLRCTRFQLTRKGKLTGTIQAGGRAADGPASFVLSYSFTPRSYAVDVYAGPVGQTLTPVEITDERLVFLAQVPSLEPPVVAYHPDDTEIWYRSAEECERDATPLHATRIYTW